MKKIVLLAAILIAVAGTSMAQTKSWTADNGNGTFTNPLFYDEFSDPDIIRVGEDFYMAGTTMHTVPGVVIMHSKDLVNWKFLSYCFDRFTFGESFELKNGQEEYGQGIWAPCIRYNNGKFYVFSNINGVGMQVFIAENPAGPWEHINMEGDIYDLSVLFDDDGKIYAVYKYDEVHLIEIKPDFSGFVEGSEKVIIEAGNAMGEGHHFYKIDGKYYIISANYSPVGRMQCARADKPEGPYQTVTISMRETFGEMAQHTINNVGLDRPVPEHGTKFQINYPTGNHFSAVPLHQGGLVDLPNGEWWGFSMIDFHSVGRTTCLSPVTWVDGWPYFGLQGNLGRTPRTWYKPNVAVTVEPHAPYNRNDNFDGKTLQPIWQWNHNPNDKMWALSKGKLRLKTMPAENFLWAKNTLTQRAIGPVSITTVELDASHLKEGDMAGLGILNMPYAILGVMKQNDELVLQHYNQQQDKWIEIMMADTKFYLRVEGEYDRDIAQFSYSLDGENYTTIGDTVLLPYQLKTFQGMRTALYAFNVVGKNGGYALFDNFTVDEPLADRSNNIPLGKIITLTNLADNSRAWANPHGMLHKANRGSRDYNGAGCKFRVHDRGNGLVALEAMNGTGFLTVTGIGLSSDVRMLKEETEASLFMWQDMLRGECMLLSMKTQRYVGIAPDTGEPYGADWAGPKPNRKDGTVFHWSIAESK